MSNQSTRDNGKVRLGGMAPSLPPAPQPAKN